MSGLPSVDRDGSVSSVSSLIDPNVGEERPTGPLSHAEGPVPSTAAAAADQMVGLGWNAVAVARTGDPGRGIVEVGRDWQADLIVTGSRGIGTLHRLVTGNVAHDVPLHAHSSVLVVRGQVPARIGEYARSLAGPGVG
ncbi:MAG: universal stress protein [Candidatus Limnocylindria bacterium]